MYFALTLTDKNLPGEGNVWAQRVGRSLANLGLSWQVSWDLWRAGRTRLSADPLLHCVCKWEERRERSKRERSKRERRERERSKRERRERSKREGNNI